MQGYGLACKNTGAFCGRRGGGRGQLRGDLVVTVDGVISLALGTDNFADYEQNVYEKYQEMAERDIIAKLSSLLSSTVFLNILKQWGKKW